MREQPWWYNRLKESGARLTEPREIVLKILHDSNDHLSATDIYVQAHRLNPSIGLTTVYRTLDMFAQLGIVQKFEFGEGTARFELMDSPDGKGHHHHLVCLKCKKIIDYSDMMDDEKEFLTKIEGQLEIKHNFKILDHLIRFYGVCNECKVE